MCKKVAEVFLNKKTKKKSTIGANRKEQFLLAPIFYL